MSQHELLKRVVTECDRLSIPLMLTGSLVSSLQGEPRATHDIDVVIDMLAESIGAFHEAFHEPGWGDWGSASWSVGSPTGLIPRISGCRLLLGDPHRRSSAG
jgi:hypothetical protein